MERLKGLMSYLQKHSTVEQTTGSCFRAVANAVPGSCLTLNAKLLSILMEPYQLFLN